MLRFRKRDLFTKRGHFTLARIIVHRDRGNLIVHRVTSSAKRVTVPNGLTNRLTTITHSSLVTTTLAKACRHKLISTTITSALRREFRFHVIASAREVVLREIRIKGIGVSSFLFFNTNDITKYEQRFQNQEYYLFLKNYVNFTDLKQLNLLQNRFFHLKQTTATKLFHLYLFLNPQLNEHDFFKFYKTTPFKLNFLQLQRKLFPFLLTMLNSKGELNFQLLKSIHQDVLFQHKARDKGISRLYKQDKTNTRV